MFALMVIIFIAGYLAIAFEHPLKIDKAAPALIIGALTWTVLMLGIDVIMPDKEYYFVIKELKHHLGDISEILFFLLGAMTIVELVDAHQGFKIVTDKITTKNKIKLMWILCAISFIFSATLDNLTAAIVMGALLTKIINLK